MPLVPVPELGRAYRIEIAGDDPVARTIRWHRDECAAITWRTGDDVDVLPGVRLAYGGLVSISLDIPAAELAELLALPERDPGRLLAALEAVHDFWCGGRGTPQWYLQVARRPAGLLPPPPFADFEVEVAGREAPRA